MDIVVVVVVVLVPSTLDISIPTKTGFLIT
jgi:hypothetical protein